MTYKITEFNQRRLQRGEKYCFRADVLEKDETVDWVWLSLDDILDIMKTENDEVIGHEEYLTDTDWKKLWK